MTVTYSKDEAVSHVVQETLDRYGHNGITILSIVEACYRANEDQTDCVHVKDAVRYLIDHPESTLKDVHAIWMAKKLDEGWKFGPEKDVAKRQHPCLVPYEQLSAHQKYKDDVFQRIVSGLRDDLTVSEILKDYAVRSQESMSFVNTCYDRAKQDALKHYPETDNRYYPYVLLIVRQCLNIHH